MGKAKFWLLAFFLTIPAFGLMLRPGIFSMHDPHLFRTQQFDLCFRSGIFPCRWSPDSSKGFGSPLFNFYAQAPYWLAETFRLVNMSILDSAKAVYIFSLVASAAAMFVFSRKHWGVTGGLVSSVFYVFAPYRAVDVWVRGAMPETLAFVLYPLILHYLDLYLEKRKLISLAGFSFFTALLLITHNLSFLMFMPFVACYWLFRSLQTKSLKTFPAVAGAGIFSLGLAGFYLLPVIFESRFVTLTDTISDYYNFQIHFATLNELFISRFWGYGASLWAQKYLSVSIGQLHWLVPVALALAVLAKRKFTRINTAFLFFTAAGFFALFLTHGKSLFLWKLFPPMEYIQFPWRFLTVAVFFLSSAAGFISTVLPRAKYSSLAMIAVIILNVGFFRPDRWMEISDAQQFSGALWDEGRSSSLTDFWPKYGPPPTGFARELPVFEVGEGQSRLISKRPQSSQYVVDVQSLTARVVFPQVYFPGWLVYSEGKVLPFEYTRFGGLISVPLTSGTHELSLQFTDTPVRRLGNYLSLISVAVLGFGMVLSITRKKI